MVLRTGPVWLDSIQAESGSELITVTNHVGMECVEEPFETPQTVARAMWYGCSGIPDVRIDGKTSVVGAVSCASAYRQYQQAFVQRQLETAGQSPVQVSGACTLAGAELSMTAEFRLIDPVVLADLRATLLIYEDNIYASDDWFYDDTWNRVTRVIYDQTISLAQPGDVATVTTTVTVPAEWNPSQLHVVTYVQTVTGNKEIIQGGVLPLETSTVDEGLGGRNPDGWVGAPQPNPFRSATNVVFGLSAASGETPVRLEIFNPAGRVVACLENRTLGPGTYAKVGRPVRRWLAGRKRRLFRAPADCAKRERAEAGRPQGLTADARLPCLLFEQGPQCPPEQRILRFLVVGLGGDAHTAPRAGRARA